MKYSEDKKRAIFESTDGRCHICFKKLSYCNYGRPQKGYRGSWEIDHSIAKANGGTNHGNNLKPCCISCNRSKGKKSGKAVRRVKGVAKSPLSSRKRNELWVKQKALTTGGCALVGSAFGPGGAIIGAGIGYWISSNNKPND